MHARPAAALAAFAFVLAACGGNGSSLPAGTTTAQHTLSAGVHRTPALPPPRLHRVTAADRARALAAGWLPVTATAPFPNGPGTELLMTDGTVMVQDLCSPAWYALVPDANGNYVNGQWIARASLPSNYAPLYFASAVLSDGKLIVNGGEYNFCKGADTTLGAIYDPVANTWTPVSPPSGWSTIGDAASVVLDNGTYMIGNCCTSTQAQFNEAAMTWTVVGSGKADSDSEEGWTLLRTGSVLTADVSNAPNSEQFSPSANAWSSAGTLPVNLVAAAEIGPQVLRPNNSVFVAGATGHTAIYHGSWVQGPDFPIVSGKQVDVADGPATLLTNGNVLVAGSPGIYKKPASFYIFDGQKLKSIGAPPNAANDSSYNVRLLMLPTGQVLDADGSSDVEIYTPAGRPNASIAPKISSVPTTLVHGNTYSISGIRFNGISQANAYGDDVQQATNYPLVRITNNATGHVFYARTHGHSFMGVGSKRTVTTMFDVPATIETGAGTLVVVTNGIASTAASVTVE